MELWLGLKDSQDLATWAYGHVLERITKQANMEIGNNSWRLKFGTLLVIQGSGQVEMALLGGQAYMALCEVGFEKKIVRVSKSLIL